MSGSRSSSPAAASGAFDQPLGLTVHSLPVPQEAALADEQRTRTGRWKMLVVALVCAAPVVASYLTYYVIRPESTRSYGELIQPQRPVPDANALTLGGETVPLATLKGQWLLVSVAPSSCDSLCEKHLYLQRQLRESLGAEKERLDWVWLVPDAGPVRAQLLPALRQATVLRVDPAVLARWLAPEPGHRIEEHLYVVDPLGHWMMRFPAGQDIGTASKVKRDLGLLMRASASWDQPGR
jgi:hypothetical protein